MHTVIVDADAIIAQTVLSDSNHEKAVIISQKLAHEGVTVIYPVTAVAEAVTVLQRVFSSGSSAYTTATIFVESKTPVLEIGTRIYSLAVNEYFSSRASKKNTLFDCIIAAVAKEHRADAIFSFDKFYKKLGFKLAGEII